MIAADLCARIAVLADLGLGYLSLDRTTTTLSPGELQRLRLATQLRSGLFGVVYVLDEPSAGLHPADAEPLMTVLDQLKAAGNSLFVVEHDMDVVRRADWIVDVGPGAGEHGGRVLYSGPVDGLEDVEESVTGAVPVRAGHRARPRAARAIVVAVPAPRHAAQPRRRRSRVPPRRPDGGDRRVRVGQVDARHPGARGRRGGLARPRAGRRRTMRTSRSRTVRKGPPPACTRSASRRSTGWSASTRSRSAAPRGPTSPPTRGCSTRCASCSPRPTRRSAAATRPGGSRSTSPAAAARRAAARGSSRSSCCSCPARTRRARRATARDTSPRRSRSACVASRSPTCSA